MLNLRVVSPGTSGQAHVRASWATYIRRWSLLAAEVRRDIGRAAAWKRFSMLGVSE